MVVVNLGECLRGSGAKPNRTRVCLAPASHWPRVHHYTHRTWGVEGANAADTTQVSRVSSMNRGGGDMNVYIGLRIILA
jgi:hypothetical protein